MKFTYYLETAALTLMVFVSVVSISTGINLSPQTSQVALLAQASPEVEVVVPDPTPDSGGGGGTNPTPTPEVDVSGPVISEVSVSATYSKATITWKTDEPATGQVEYGPTFAFNGISPLDGSFLKNHSVEIPWLRSDSIYQFKIASRDASGNVTYTTSATFHTDALPYTPLPSVKISVPDGRSTQYDNASNLIPSYTPYYSSPSPTPTYTPPSSSSYTPPASGYVPPASGGGGSGYSTYYVPDVPYVAPKASPRIVRPTGKPLPEPSLSPIPPTDPTPFVYRQKKNFWQIVGEIFKDLW